ncbi:hypothetical protein GLUCOINTEAF2_0202726 [Komagataeibacter intermedius AF2]|uniref:Uncharacterized protein n=2 Tax=Komagataeibacter intermedius TaxID=66229 RepID=A0A0N1FAI3_9PROT|nr:hypothetical protein GLUCOINTEAF2_0202726 [Komagataeibacter intermedius AF2]
MKPVIECRAIWVEYPKIGQILQIDFNITNNLNRRLDIEAISVCRPDDVKIIENVRNSAEVFYGSGKKLETVTWLPLNISMMRKDGEKTETDKRLLPSRIEERVYAIPSRSCSLSDRSLSIRVRCSRNSFAIFRTFESSRYTIPQQ